MDEITNCTSVKGSSIWAGVTFNDASHPTEGSNFAFTFKSKNTKNLTRFKLFDGEQQKVKFGEKFEQKVPQLDFRIDDLI